MDGDCNYYVDPAQNLPTKDEIWMRSKGTPPRQGHCIRIHRCEKERGWFGSDFIVHAEHIDKRGKEFVGHVLYYFLERYVPYVQDEV